jgi:hypothetical protein
VSRYHDQVAAAFAAVTIRGPTRYAWMGRASRPLPPPIYTDLKGSERRRYLVSSLREELYASFYCHGRPVPARWGERGPISPDPWLTDALSRANTGGGGWEPGWTVQRLEAKEAVAETDRLRARVPVGDIRSQSGVVRPGADVSVRLPKGLPELSPGFYTVVSEAPTDLGSAESVVRAYWNVSATGAPELVVALASRLNERRVQFRLKVADHPFRFTRCDAAVLYLPGDAFPALREPLREVAAALSHRLGPEIPAFTLELVPGVGLAEDSRDGQSFGARRCQLLADAIVRAHEQGITETEAQVDAVAERFAEDGVQIDAPYREPSLAGRHVF